MRNSFIGFAQLWPSVRQDRYVVETEAEEFIKWFNSRSSCHLEFEESSLEKHVCEMGKRGLEMALPRPPTDLLREEP